MSDERAKKVGAALAEEAKTTVAKQAKKAGAAAKTPKRTAAAPVGATTAKSAAPEPQAAAAATATLAAAEPRSAAAVAAEPQADVAATTKPAAAEPRSAAAAATAAPATASAPAEPAVAASTAAPAAAPAGTAATDAARTAADAAAEKAREEELKREADAAAAAAAAPADAAAAAANADTGAPAEEPKPRSTRQRIADGAVDVAEIGAKAVQTVSLAGLRAAMPLIELYAERRAADDQQGDLPGRLGLTLGEERVLKAAALKAMVETIEITSQTDPLMAGAPAYHRLSTNGEPQAPNLAQLMSVALAANRLWERDDKIEECEPAPVSPPQSVAYVAVAPGEYQATQAPLTPTQVRRSAMRERSYNSPQPAMLVYSAEGYSTAPATAYGQPSAFASNRRAMGTSRMPTAYRARGSAGSCGCGSSGCGGCGSGGPRTFPPARYKEDGSCAALFDISCETRWRVRECFKIAFCDLLRCLGEELCEDGAFVQDPELGACLERFVCSILTCLPEAICPSGGEEICCLPADTVSCGCNFAVGE